MDYIRVIINIISTIFVKFSNLFLCEIRGIKDNLSGKAFIKKSRISQNVKYGDGCKFYLSTLSGDINLGCRTSIYGPNTQILSKINPIFIGKYCSIASGVLIIEYAHNLKRVSTYYLNQNVFGGSVNDDLTSKGPIHIGNDVWIGANSIVLGGVTIGNGAVIAAGSIVNKDVPPYAIVVGNPAKIIKYRFPDERIRELESSLWWDWSYEEIAKNKCFFNKEYEL